MLSLAVAAYNIESSKPVKSSLFGFDVDRGTEICKQFGDGVEYHVVLAPLKNTCGYSSPPAWRHKTNKQT
jgi:hypothetical protein